MEESSRSAFTPVLRDIKAVVFDTDGVITDSAQAHAAAWKTAFDAYLSEHPPEDPRQRRPFDARDGVDRADAPDAAERLLRHGARIVVHDLGELLEGGPPA